MKLKLAFSTCPNDTYIFDAIVNKRIDTEGLDFEIFMADVEDLNINAFQNTYHITKLSYHAYAYLQDNYQILNSGSALGSGNGPLFISKKNINNLDFNTIKVAIPGKYTTANFLFSIAYPDIKNKIPMLFSDIEQAISESNVDAGVIIHENRFTYSERGFVKICDLGEFWEQLTSMPIPLGGIAINRNLSEEIKLKFSRILKKSIQYAFDNKELSKQFIKQHAQELDDDIIEKHIKLFVNEYSLNLGDAGRKAINTMLEQAYKTGLIDNIRDDIFVKNY